MKLIGVVAVSLNNCIGKQGTIPWRYPEDFKYFRSLTLDSTVIMGRKTWDSLPADKRPLPRRNNVVITRTPPNEHSYPNTFFTTLENLDKIVRPLKEPHFKELSHCIQEFHVTYVQDVVEGGDTFFQKEILNEFKEFNTIKLSDKCIVKRYNRF